MREPGMAGADQLVKLVKECLVLVSGRLVGSGFFVAPGMIATCAHVAGAPGDVVRVDWRDTSLPGVVRWASPLTDRKIVPYPDMALVEVESSGHPMVWLDDQLPAMSDQLVVFGHARTFTPEAARKSGWFKAGGEYGDMIRLIDDEISPGMSGAPVLNAETGGVCAITKATANEEPGLPSGGVAVPVRALREVMEPGPYRLLRRGHEAYHRRNRRWTGLAHELPRCGGPVGRRAEGELRAILARLPEAGHDQHLAAFRAVAGDLPDPPRHPLHDHGDVVTELAGLLPAEDGFPHLLTYAIEVSRSAQPVLLAELLRQWARMTPRNRRDQDEVAKRLSGERQAAPAGPARLPSVLVYVRPAGQDRQRYHCELWRYAGADEVVPIATEEPDRSLGELRGYLRERLPALARAVSGEGRPMIELVLPYELLDEDVEQWPEAPDRNPWSVLGQTNPVVVRDLERFDEPEERTEDWRQRWQALADRDMGTALTTVSCLEQRGHRALYSLFRLDPARAALTLPRPLRAPITRTVLEVGLYCGVPVMVWRRNGCDGEPEKSHQDCPGSRLAKAVEAELAGGGRDDVPERIMRLRNRAGAEGEPECGHDVVLLWDDPGRRLPRPRMLSPMGEGHATG
ncbi:trypsin-like peptidase domain-containing protein [Actinoplanes sp. GCM10030250]|uniref:VMAP-C domain-containing protein n=1 Tax=Actinoplanes sp. GCM10030250 TaxID=3273376 RepID=UPI00360D2514